LFWGFFRPLTQTCTRAGSGTLSLTSIKERWV
jgi:hypothetical protein